MNDSNQRETRLIDDLNSQRARVGVIGLGYVGLPLLLDFAYAGFKVTGIDVDSERITNLRKGISHVVDIPSARLREIPADRIHFASDYAAASECDALLICVPTPLNKTRDPDVHFLIECAQSIVPILRPGMLVSLESTTYPGTTSELLRPILEERGLVAGSDFFLSFSPERIDPGRALPLRLIPKVVGGLTPSCLRVAQALYGQIIERVVPVSSTESAEMVKLLENTFRAVNIALVNEVAIMCDKLGLDVWEVVDAAATKPYGFMKFLPGPGVGGHCIPLDPHYLSWKLKTLNYTARFIQLASEINTSMPHYWAEKVQDSLNLAGLPLKGSRILVLGVTYKKNIDDIRESPALDIIERLLQKGARVTFFDPHVEKISHHGLDMTGTSDLEKALEDADCVVVATDHDAFDWEHVKTRAPILVDTRYVFKQARPEPVREGS